MQQTVFSHKLTVSCCSLRAETGGGRGRWCLLLDFFLPRPSLSTVSSVQTTLRGRLLPACAPFSSARSRRIPTSSPGCASGVPVPVSVIVRDAPVAPTALVDRPFILLQIYTRIGRREFDILSGDSSRACGDAVCAVARSKIGGRGELVRVCEKENGGQGSSGNRETLRCGACGCQA